MELRKITYRMYPGTSQLGKLEEQLGLHRRVYNAALQERIRVYGETGKSLGFAAQCRELTAWRKQCATLAAVNAQSLQLPSSVSIWLTPHSSGVLKRGKRPGSPASKQINGLAVGAIKPKISPYQNNHICAIIHFQPKWSVTKIFKSNS